MHIVATADLHGTLPNIPECDLLIIAGDVCPMHDHSVVFQRLWLETNFSEWLRRQPAGNIIGIGGNHDFALEKYPDLGPSLPWAYLSDSEIVINGIKFYGVPWVPNLSRWAFHLADHQLDEKYDLIPDDVDVLIVHGPPHNYCDHTSPKFGNMPVGFPADRHLDRILPELYVTGHIHEAYGHKRHPNGTLIANVSHMTENYEALNKPVYFHLTQRGRLQGYSADYRPAREEY